MNNIKGANIVTLKQPISNKAKDNLNNQPIYSITATTQNQKSETLQALRFKYS